jgi:hypothetical protein
MEPVTIELNGLGLELMVRLTEETDKGVREAMAYGHINESTPLDELAQAEEHLRKITEHTKAVQQAIISSIVDLVDHDKLRCTGDFADWEIDLTKQQQGIGVLHYKPASLSAVVQGEALKILLELRDNAEETAESQFAIYENFKGRIESDFEDMSEHEKDVEALRFSDAVDALTHEGILRANGIIGRFIKVFNVEGFNRFEDIVKCSIDFTTAEHGFVTIRRENEDVYKARHHQQLLDGLDTSGPAN